MSLGADGDDARDSQLGSGLGSSADFRGILDASTTLVGL